MKNENRWGFVQVHWALRVPIFLVALLATLLVFASSTQSMSASTFAAQTADDETVTLEVVGTTMGVVRYRVLVVSNEPTDAEKSKLKSTVSTTLSRVNDLMSTYQDDSDVSRFNRTESTDWFDVDSETATVVNRAQEISQLSDGAFDITVGPAVQAWNFGAGKGEFEIPTEKTIEELKQNTGFGLIEVRLSPPALKKSNPKAGIDLSAIAKGYAVDAVAAALENLGYKRLMVEVGGEVFAAGERASGGAWRIAVESPNAMGKPFGSSLAKYVEVLDTGIATSGNYRNFEMHQGVRYSHTIDPRTCRPVTHNLATASVVAKNCMTADALATAVMVMGEAGGHELCESLNCELFTMVRNGEELSQQSSENFPVFELPVEDDPEAKIVAASSTKTGPSIWPTFLAALVVFGLMILAMSVGAIFNNRPVQGSCGGLANMTNEDGDEVCGVCSKPTTDCVESTTT
jgi:thiamine biosynthesis lipoprotein